MLDFSSRYNVLLIEQEVFFMKRNGYANRAKKLPSGVLPQKNGSPPSKTPSETLPTTFLLRSEPTWGLCRICSHLPSKKKLWWSYFSLRVLVPPFTQLRRYWYSRPYMAEVKHLQTRQHEAFANYTASEAVLHNGGFAECRGLQFPLGHRAPIIHRLITVVSKTVYPSPGLNRGLHKVLNKSWSPCPLSLALVCLISCLHISNPRRYLLIKFRRVAVFGRGRALFITLLPPKNYDSKLYPSI